MGYSTHFTGTFWFDRPLEMGLYNELKDINKTRHGGRIDTDQHYPGMFCQWTPDKTNTGLTWDGREKFYDYIPWLKWLVENKFKPGGYVLNGRVAWHGEDPTDIGTIEIKDNEIYTTKGMIHYDWAKTVKV
jgi:hypothetical protein